MKLNATTHRFFDPHPGMAGCTAPLPPEIKKVSDALDGQVLPIEDVLQQLRAVAGKMEVKDAGGMITLMRGSFARNEFPVHSWRVLRYE